MTGNAQWLSSKDAAAQLGLVGPTLYRLINRGELPAYRFGRVIRIKQADVDDYIRAQRIAPGSQSHLDRDGPPVDDSAEEEDDDE